MAVLATAGRDRHEGAVPDQFPACGGKAYVGRFGRHDRSPGWRRGRPLSDPPFRPEDTALRLSLRCARPAALYRCGTGGNGAPYRSAGMERNEPRRELRWAGRAHTSPNSLTETSARTCTLVLSEKRVDLPLGAGLDGLRGVVAMTDPWSVGAVADGSTWGECTTGTSGEIGCDGPSRRLTTTQDLVWARTVGPVAECVAGRLRLRAADVRLAAMGCR